VCIFFPISQFGFKTRPTLIFVLIIKSCRFGCFRARGSVQIYNPTKIDAFINIVDQYEINEHITIKTRLSVVVHAIYIPFTNLDC
jgi:hypothetical protein